VQGDSRIYDLLLGWGLGNFLLDRLPSHRLDSTSQKPGSSRRRGIASVEKLGRIKANKDISLSTSIENVLSGSEFYLTVLSSTLSDITLWVIRTMSYLHTFEYLTIVRPIRLKIIQNIIQLR
jgi:hypothetical protein